MGLFGGGSLGNTGIGTPYNSQSFPTFPVACCRRCGQTDVPACSDCLVADVSMSLSAAIHPATERVPFYFPLHYHLGYPILDS